MFDGLLADLAAAAVPDPSTPSTNTVNVQPGSPSQIKAWSDAIFGAATNAAKTAWEIKAMWSNQQGKGVNIEKNTAKALGISSGAMIGIGVVGLIVVGAAAWWFLRKKK